MGRANGGLRCKQCSAPTPGSTARKLCSKCKKFCLCHRCYSQAEVSDSFRSHKQGCQQTTARAKPTAYVPATIVGLPTGQSKQVKLKVRQPEKWAHAELIGKKVKEVESHAASLVFVPYPGAGSIPRETHLLYKLFDHDGRLDYRLGIVHKPFTDGANVDVKTSSGTIQVAVSEVLLPYRAPGESRRGRTNKVAECPFQISIKFIDGCWQVLSANYHHDGHTQPPADMKLPATVSDLRADPNLAEVATQVRLCVIGPGYPLSCRQRSRSSSGRTDSDPGRLSFLLRASRPAELDQHLTAEREGHGPPAGR